MWSPDGYQQLIADAWSMCKEILHDPAKMAVEVFVTRLPGDRMAEVAEVLRSAGQVDEIAVYRALDAPLANGAGRWAAVSLDG